MASATNDGKGKGALAFAASLPPPQLARKCYSVDTGGTSSSDDESSLEILSPIRSKDDKAAQVRQPVAAADEDDDRDNRRPGHLGRDGWSPLSSSSSSGGSEKRPGPGVGRKRIPPLERASDAPDDAFDEPKTVRTLDFSCRTTAATSTTSDDDEEDEDGDDSLLNSRRANPESQGSTKGRFKRLREEQKEREKQSRAESRNREREAKEREKTREKAAKKRQDEEHAQAMGKYKHGEVAALVDPSLYVEDPHGIVKKVSEDFLVHSYPSLLQSRSSSPSFGDFAAVQFVRKDHLDGGAKDAVACLESNKAGGYEHLHHLILVIDPDEFIPLLRRDEKEEDDDYPALESWAATVQARWRNRWGLPKAAEPKILILLRDLPHALDKKWVEHRRRHRNEPSLPTLSELLDAVQWLLVQFQVECIFCPTVDLMQTTVHKMCRALCEKPYVDQVSELQCIKKIKQGAAATGDPMAKARDVWLRQLQQVPGLSEAKAQNVVERYPTCQSLWQAYQRGGGGGEGRSVNHSTLLGPIFSGGVRNESKLSDAVYKLMTSNEPDEMIL